LNAEEMRRRAAGMAEDLVRWRRWFHRNPELELDCYETGRKIVEELRSIGVEEVVEGLARSGVVATVRGGPGPTVAVRCDMDALPVTEETGLPFQSRHPGRAHACGHDGHMAIGLGLARLFAGHGGDLPGNVKVLFQPGEEYPCGAPLMIEGGALEDPRVDAMIGFHIFPGLPAGTFGLRQGVMTARNDEFTVRIEGSGGHGAYPHECADPVVAAGSFVTGVQTIASRRVSPVDPLVVTIGEIHGGKGHNVIATEVVLKGTVRSVSEDGRSRALEGLRGIARAVESMHGVKCALDLVVGEPALKCSPEITAAAAAALREAVGEDCLTFIETPSLGSDDFAFYSEAVPVTYIRVGCRAEGYESALHTPTFDFDERILPDALHAIAVVVLRVMEAVGADASGVGRRDRR